MASSTSQKQSGLVERSSRYDFLISAILVVAMAALSYLPLISQLGFYRDDWYQLWAGYIYGPDSIATLFSIDRPFTGLLYSLAYRVLGPSPLPWHLYSFGLRVAGALIFLWLVRWLWPRARLMTTSMAVLFVVYPGFLQQPNANTFSNQLLTYTTGLFSIALTLAAVTARSRGRRIFLYLFSVITAIAYWLNYEYMIGLEGLRLVLLWFAVSRLEFEGPRWKKVFAYWAPFIPALVIYLFWRAFLFESGREATDLGLIWERFLSDPLRTTLGTLLEGAKDLVETTLIAWAIPYYDSLTAAGLGEQIVALTLGILAAGLFILYFTWLVPRLADRTVAASDQPGKPIDGAHGKQAIIVGAIAIVFAVAPVILAGRDVHWHSGFDRYTLHVTAGVSIFIVGLIWYLLRSRNRPWLIAGLIVVAVTTHYLNGLQWADFWKAQQNLWWQLSWRAPQIEDSTVLVAEIPAGGFFEDYEIWAPANLIYNAVPGPINITAEIFNQQTAQKIRFGSEDGRGMRELIEFHRDYDDVLILSYPSYGSCLHVIDGRVRDFPQAASGLVQSVARYSKIDRVLVDSLAPNVPELVFGPEPEPGWCYYYQKSSLARQAEDWDEVVRLGQEAMSLGIRPSDRSEWMPFLEGYAMLGMDDKTKDIGVFIRDDEPVRHHICDHLDPNAYDSEDQFQLIFETLCEFGSS